MKLGTLPAADHRESFLANTLDKILEGPAADQLQTKLTTLSLYSPWPAGYSDNQNSILD